MKRIWLIGLKDIRLAFRDKAALIMMLAAPFLLTVGLGLTTGSFGGGGNSGLADIPVVLVNQDRQALGNALVEVFQSEALATLMEPLELEDPPAAKKMVDDDLVAAVIIIPTGFTDSILQQDSSASDTKMVKLEVYINPNLPTSAGVVQSVVEAFISRVETVRVGSAVTLQQLLTSGLIQMQEIPAISQQLAERQSDYYDEEPLLQLVTSQNDNETFQFNVLAIMAPAMALMFLMYTVAYGGRSILVEKRRGTLPRLLVSPTSTAEVLGGKVLGIYLTGVAQLFILIGGCALLFRLEWGDPLGVIVLVLAAVFGATGWGMLLTAIARTPGQVANIGSALMLTFGILGGNFINLEYLPKSIQWISKITPNSWGLDGFFTLALGGGLPDLLNPIAALLIMGVVLFTIAVLLFNRSAIYK